MPTFMQTLDNFVMPEPNSGCWLWLGATNEKGYARSHGKPVHRKVYERMVGPIPTGLELDHLCRNRICVNPDHLEPVTHKVNVLRGDSPLARQARQTHCKRGHPLDGTNLYRTSNGGRDCRTCWNLRPSVVAKKETLNA